VRVRLQRREHAGGVLARSLGGHHHRIVEAGAATVPGMAPGRLITIEGLDGAGKSTLAASLAERLHARLLREPGGVDLSERLRSLLKDPALHVGAPAEALLYAAARAQLVEEQVRPLLESGVTVVLDRFVDSSLAYQGAARGLGVAAIAQINELATGGLRPDRTLLLRIPPSLGRARQRARADRPDRLEREGDDFFAAIAAAYDELARAEPERIRVIPASQNPERVLAAALAELADLGL
jgi:dTMP kinase